MSQVKHWWQTIECALPGENEETLESCHCTETQDGDKLLGMLTWGAWRRFVECFIVKTLDDDNVLSVLDLEWTEACHRTETLRVVNYSVFKQGRMKKHLTYHSTEY